MISEKVNMIFTVYKINFCMKLQIHFTIYLELIIEYIRIIRKAITEYLLIINKWLQFQNVFEYIGPQIFIHNLLVYDDITIIYRPIVVKMASAYEKQNEEENMDDNF